MPNDYTKAYEEFVKDTDDIENVLGFEEFKKAVHHYDDEKREYTYDKYVRLVKSLVNEIDMVDPSGGPYISVGMPMDSLGFKGYVVEGFERIDTGYKIITESTK